MWSSNQVITIAGSPSASVSSFVNGVLGHFCPARKLQHFKVKGKGMRQMALTLSEKRAPASAHGTTCRDPLLRAGKWQQMCAVLVMGITTGRKQNAAPWDLRRGCPGWESKTENRAQSKNVVGAERSCWCLPILCYAILTTEQWNGSLYMSKRRDTEGKK